MVSRVTVAHQCSPQMGKGSTKMKVLVFCLIYFLISWFEFSLETQPAAQQSSAPQKSSSGAGYSLPAHFGQRRIGAPHLVLRHDQSAGFGRAVFGDLAGTLSSGGETEAPCRVNELGHVSCGVGVEELASRRAGEVPSGTAHCTKIRSWDLQVLPGMDWSTLRYTGIDVDAWTRAEPHA
eukprot:2844855-Rhodomonas_salina.1